MTIPRKKPSTKPGWQSGNDNNSHNAKLKKHEPAPDWLDEHYGYRKTLVGKEGHKTVKWVYVGQTQYLNEQLGNTKIDGVLDLLPLNASMKEADAKAAGFQGGPSRLPGSDTQVTANQAMYLFKNADPGDRARVQDMMYRAGGLYSKKYHPIPGAPLTKQDIDAFRKFLIGVASNPAQGRTGELLDQSAKAGDALGEIQNDNSVYKPLVRQVSNPMDIQDVANKVGKELHGTYLSADQLKVFTSAYQTMEKAYQEQVYTDKGGDLNTGWMDPDNAVATTAIKPASVASMADTAVRTQNPTEFKANTFTDRLNVILDSLRGPGGNPTQVGPL